MKKLFFALSVLSSMTASAAVNVEITARLNQETGSISGKLPAQESLCVRLNGVMTAVNLLSESEDTAKFQLVILQAFRDEKEFGPHEVWRPVSEQEITVTLGQSKKVTCSAKGVDAEVTISATKQPLI